MSAIRPWDNLSDTELLRIIAGAMVNPVTWEPIPFPGGGGGTWGTITGTLSDQTDLAAALADATPPYPDTVPIVKGSVDPDKLLRFEIDGWASSPVTHEITIQDQDGTMPLLESIQTFTVEQTINIGGILEGDDTALGLRNTAVANPGDPFQNSPALTFEAHAWDNGTSADVKTEWYEQVTYASSVARNRLAWYAEVDGGAPTLKAYFATNGPGDAANFFVGAIYTGEIQLTDGFDGSPIAALNGFGLNFSEPGIMIGNSDVTTPLHFVSVTDAISSWQFSNQFITTGNLVEILGRDSHDQSGDYLTIGSSTDGLTLANILFRVDHSGNVFGGAFDSQGNITAMGDIIASGNVTGANLSGTNTGNQTITLTGDVTGSGTGSFAATLASTLTGVYNFAPALRTSGSAPYLTITAPADTGLTASTEAIGVRHLGATRQHATGALALQREHVFGAPTYSFVGASTLTTAVTLDVADPIAGTNATITNKYSLRAAAVLITGAATIQGAAILQGATTRIGSSTTDSATFTPGWFGGNGIWIDMTTSGPSGIGSGGAGSNPWIGYVSNTDIWFTGAVAGDIAYRNITGAMHFGNTNNAAPAMTMKGDKLGIGIITAAVKLHVVGTTEPLRVGYDTSNYFSTTISSAGAVTFDAVGASAGFTFSDSVTMADAKNLIFNTSTGTIIGTATGQKFAFHNATPVIQRVGAAQAATATTAATNVAPFGFTTAAQADAIVTLLNEIRAALVEKGLIKGAA